MGESEHFLWEIDESWSDDHAIGIRGWFFGKDQPVRNLSVRLGDREAPITSWHARPDVAAAYPQYRHTANCGFWVQIPRAAEHRVTFSARSEGRAEEFDVSFSGSAPTPDPGSGGGLFGEFIRIVNEGRLHVLEIGSRIVCQGSASKRSLFPQAASYTGFDYYPDGNTDVVGDAHRLTQYFGGRRFDAVFSLAVFEHLAMPWLVALEIGKILNPGGITFHATHFAWPLHERPWDFWRFSDEGLKSLFSAAAGFQVIDVGLFTPVKMYLDNLDPGLECFPKQPAYAHASILARKRAEADTSRLRWDVDLHDVLGDESHYPPPAADKPQ